MCFRAGGEPLATPRPSSLRAATQPLACQRPYNLLLLREVVSSEAAGWGAVQKLKRPQHRCPTDTHHTSPPALTPESDGHAFSSSNPQRAFRLCLKIGKKKEKCASLLRTTSGSNSNRVLQSALKSSRCQECGKRSEPGVQRLAWGARPPSHSQSPGRTSSWVGTRGVRWRRVLSVISAECSDSVRRYFHDPFLLVCVCE